MNEEIIEEEILDEDAESDSVAGGVSDRIEALIKPVVEAQGFKLFNIEAPFNSSGGRSGGVLRVYIWKGRGGQGNGVILDECARVSKALELVTELDEVIEGAYVLEVSSPGINRKLSKLEHFETAISEFVKIVTLDGRVVAGVLKECSGGKLSVDHVRDDGEGESVQLELGQIKRARIEFQFD